MVVLKMGRKEVIFRRKNKQDLVTLGCRRRSHPGQRRMPKFLDRAGRWVS